MGGWLLLLLSGFLLSSAHGELIRVATFNAGNYLDLPSGKHPVKPAQNREIVLSSILALKPDLLALQEMGSTNMLLNLQLSLKTAGLDLPFWEHVTGADTNLHLAILSRFPFVSRHPHTNCAFLLDGRRFRVSRGFAEVVVRIDSQINLTVIAAHLKSRRASLQADEADWREQEARALRAIIEPKLSDPEQPFLIVLGDFNDSFNSKPIQTVIGQARRKLLDTRPAERAFPAFAHSSSGSSPPKRGDRSPVVWTHYFSQEDVYSRVDYIFISPPLKQYWRPQDSYVLSRPDWGEASDHRPLVVAFEFGTKQKP